MADETMARVADKTAAEVCKRFTPGEAALGLLRDAMAPRPYLGLLIEHQQFTDAARFLAHALPKREAVWWACLCVRKVSGEAPPAAVAAALKAAEAWVSDPTEEHRCAAQAAAEAAGYATAAGCASAGAFWSGGSLGPPNVPAIPPGEHLTAHGASSAVMLAAVATEPEKAPEKFRAFFQLGIEIADGGHPWPAPAPEATAPSRLRRPVLRSVRARPSPPARP